MSALVPVLLAAWRPVAGVLVAGLIRFLTDYQHDGHALADLVDGALVAAEAAAGVIGVPVLVAGVGSMVAQARAAQISVPPAPPP